MKNKTFILVPALVLLLAGVALDDAAAGLFGRRDKSDEKELTTYRFNRAPTMSFARGRIIKETFYEWKIDDMRVMLGPDCKVIDSKGEEARIRDGGEVIIMGARAGDTIVAWQVRVMKPSYMRDISPDRSLVKRSEANPDVGEGTERSPI